jgi:hypothetical protein
MLLTWRYAHVVRRPVAEPGTSYDEAGLTSAGGEPGPTGRRQTVIPRFSHTSATSMPTF